MELLFRKYFWTVHLAFLAAAGLLGAKIVNTFIEAQLAPAVEIQADDGRRRPPPRIGLATIHLERTAAAFGIELPQEEPEVDEGGPGGGPGGSGMAGYDPDAEAVRSSLRATLIGTMVANRPEWSFATLRDDTKSPREVGMYLPGDRFMEAEILSVERLRVVILNEGRKEFIAIGDGPPPPTPTPAVAQTTRQPATKGGEMEIEKIDDNNYVIPRDEIDKQLSNLNAIATQARIVPSFKNGQANGFKVFSIRPNSLYQKIGVQNGDVIRRINGFEINSPEKALEVYSKLKESSRIEIELERRGKPVTKNYTIK